MSSFDRPPLNSALSPFYLPPVNAKKTLRTFERSDSQTFLSSLLADQVESMGMALSFDIPDDPLAPPPINQDVSESVLPPVSAVKTPEMASEVYSANFDGMKGVIMEKLGQASTPLYAGDPIAQTRLLISAFYDVQSFIDAIENDAGGQLTPQMQALISQLKNLQSLVLQRLKTAIGVDLNEDELRELLTNDPKHLSKDAKTNTNKDNVVLDKKTSIVSLKAVGQKLAKQIQTLTQQASQLLAEAQNNPQKAATSITLAMALLVKGLQITMIGSALEGLMASESNTKVPTGQGSVLNYSQEKERLMLLLSKASQISKGNGLTAHDMVTSTTFQSSLN